MTILANYSSFHPETHCIICGRHYADPTKACDHCGFDFHNNPEEAARQAKAMAPYVANAPQPE